MGDNRSFVKGKIIARVLPILLICLVVLSLRGSANSGPTHWDGRPSAELLIVDEDTAIEVISEELIFDCRDDQRLDWGLMSKVTATYQMHNTGEEEWVTMAFPLLGNVSDVQEHAMVTVDGEAIDMEVYIGQAMTGDLYDSEGGLKAWDFDSILGSIKHDHVTFEGIGPEEDCVLYSISHDGSSHFTELSIHMVVDQNLARVITTPGSGGRFSDDSITLTADLRSNESFHMLILGDPEGVAINEVKANGGEVEVDIFKQDGITPISFCQDYLKPIIAVDDIDDVQVYNTLMPFLYEQTWHSFGVTEASMIYDLMSWPRIVLMVYEVGFMADETREIAVNYRTNASMDSGHYGRNTKHTFDYFLTPAANWKSFGQLDITVLTGPGHSEMVKSSLEFTRSDDNRYTASLADLPEQDLSFTLKETKEEAPIEAPPRSLLTFILVLLVFVMAAVTVLLIARRAMKRRKA